jgi:hypothetical protein
MTPEERAKALLREIDACDCVPCINEVAAVIRAIYEDAAKKITFYRDMWLAQRVENENFRKQLGLVPVSDEAEAILRNKTPTDDHSKE